MKFGWLNVFQLCKFLKALGHVMVLVVLALLGLSYYSVVFLTLIPAFNNTDALWLKGVVIALMVVFSLVIFMIVWSYFAAVVQDPGSVPEGWHPFGDDETAQRELQQWLMYGDTLYDRADPRRPRYCRKCSGWKPERTHHCSVSGKCILKMDHYCIWVVNCVGLLNYKFFFLFLAYTWLGSVMALAILTSSMVEFMKRSKETGSTIVFFTFVIDAAFVLSLLGFLAMHIKLLTVNCTSIEMYEKQRVNPWPYDLGAKRNLEEVLGSNRWMWFIPLHVKEEEQRLLDAVLSRLMDVEAREAEQV
ncbi:hypothetical protein BSKO_02285 [Bryopsis sp. KO-2023]|nr:hypothetical protein BSKO_02285 [Bryopsis sp. KO-2023]